MPIHSKAIHQAERTYIDAPATNIESTRPQPDCQCHDSSRPIVPCSGSRASITRILVTTPHTESCYGHSNQLINRLPSYLPSRKMDKYFPLQFQISMRNYLKEVFPRITSQSIILSYTTNHHLPYHIHRSC